MAKAFYTEKDIDELFQQGVTSLALNDDVVLTELAYEKAKRLNMTLLSDQPDNHPSAPIRPYLSKVPQARPAVSAGNVQPPSALPPAPKPTTPAGGKDLSQNIRSAVIAKLGNSIDSDLLETIISRVLVGTGLK